MTQVEWLAVRAALHAYLADEFHEPLNIAHGLLSPSWLAHLRQLPCCCFVTVSGQGERNGMDKSREKGSDTRAAFCWTNGTNDGHSWRRVGPVILLLAKYLASSSEPNKLFRSDPLPPRPSSLPSSVNPHFKHRQCVNLTLIAVPPTTSEGVHATRHTRCPTQVTPTRVSTVPK